MNKSIFNLTNKFTALIKGKFSKAKHHDVDNTGDCGTDDYVDHTDFIGDFPERLTSGPAQTLEKLLKGQRLHCMSASNGVSSNRLKDQIASLRNNYGWTHIESEYKTVTTKNGRSQRVMEYWLRPQVIACAEFELSKAWCKEVRAACRARKCQTQIAKVTS